MPACSAPSRWRPLTGLDRVLGTLERLAAHAARRYHIVVLSDHGQSQGQSFRDRFGADLGEVCTRLMEQKVASLDAPVEDVGAGGLPRRRPLGRRSYRPRRQPRRRRKQATRRPERRSRDQRRRHRARLGKPRPAVRPLPCPAHPGGAAGALAQSHSWPVRTRGHRLHRGPRLCRCAVGARCRRPGPARHRRGDRTRILSGHTATMQPGCSAARS